jgi:hypothetical protein
VSLTTRSLVALRLPAGFALLEAGRFNPTPPVVAAALSLKTPATRIKSTADRAAVKAGKLGEIRGNATDRSEFI